MALLRETGVYVYYDYANEAYPGDFTTGLIVSQRNEEPNVEFLIAPIAGSTPGKVPRWIKKALTVINTEIGHPRDDI